MRLSLFCGAGRLAGFMLRRDRLTLPLWIIGIFSFVIMMPPLFAGLYPTAEVRQVLADTLNSPVMTALTGPGFGLHNYTVGAMTAHMTMLYAVVTVALMNIFLVVRHTRKDEESGRMELIRSLPVGRLAGLSAAMITALCANAVLALLVGLGLTALSIESVTFGGSMLFGAALGTAGLVFAGAAAVFAQLSQNTRSVLGYSLAFLIAAFMLRAAGDTGSAALTWISPIGWALQTQVFVNNYWWPAVLAAAAAIALCALALRLNLQRDLGAGLIAAKPGKARASACLLSPLGLAWRLVRTSFFAWAVGIFVIGLSYGAVLGDLDSFFQDNDTLWQMLPGGSAELALQFVSMLVSVISMMSLIPVLLILFRLTAEERSGRNEHLLARAVPRTRLMLSFFTLSVAASAVMAMLSAAGIAAAAAAVPDSPVSFPDVCRAFAASLPATWMLVGTGTLLAGLCPRAAGVTWLYLGFCFFASYLGVLLQLPGWLTALSPFEHVPHILLGEQNLSALSVMTIAAAALSAAGFAAFNRRDMLTHGE